VDRVTEYRRLIQQQLKGLEEVCNRRPAPGVETLCVFDEVRDHYLLVSTGWFHRERVRGTTVFARIKGGKILIEEDWTEDGIVPELLAAGVLKEDIVSGLQPPETRLTSEIAVA
jgi:hypothetical protein